MNLYEYLELTKKDYDTYDKTMDVSVTVCHIGKESDNYDKFCNELMKKVEVTEITNNGENPVVNWSVLVTNNLDKFRAFTTEYWKYQYEDDEEELIFQWCLELHNYLAGMVSGEFYGTLVEFLETIDSVETKTYIVCINDSYLRDTQVFNPENTAALSYMNCDAAGTWFDEEMENDDNWHDYKGYAFLGVYKWNEATKENLREYVAKKHGLMPEILDIISVD